MNAASPLLPRIDRIERLLSTPEYYHACIGTSPYTLESAREVVFVVEGIETDGMSVPDDAWMSALDSVVAQNPGTRLRMVGKRRQASWRSDGLPPRLRFISGCPWNGLSAEGAEFIEATTLSLVDGPCVELIVARCSDSKTRVIARALHACMDGVGVMHFLAEIFRALRDEKLVGSNADFSDVDLMRAVGGMPRPRSALKPVPLTGGARGDQTGDSWQRLSLGKTPSALLARVALALADYTTYRTTTHHTSLPKTLVKPATAVRIAIPVNLRRHLPDLVTTTNFSNMLHVDVQPGDSIADFRMRLAALLATRAEMHTPPLLDLLRVLPMPWMDRLVSRTPRNYTRRRLLETAVISNLGHYRSADYSADCFRAQHIFGIPLRDNPFLFLFSVDGRTDITVGMASIYASEDRLSRLMNFLQERLT